MTYAAVIAETLAGYEAEQGSEVKSPRATFHQEGDTENRHDV